MWNVNFLCFQFIYLLKHIFTTQTISNSSDYGWECCVAWLMLCKIYKKRFSLRDNKLKASKHLFFVKLQYYIVAWRKEVLHFSVFSKKATKAFLFIIYELDAMISFYNFVWCRMCIHMTKFYTIGWLLNGWKEKGI